MAMAYSFEVRKEQPLFVHPDKVSFVRIDRQLDHGFYCLDLILEGISTRLLFTFGAGTDRTREEARAAAIEHYNRLIEKLGVQDGQIDENDTSI